MRLDPCLNADWRDDSEMCSVQFPTLWPDCIGLGKRLPGELRRTGYQALSNIRVSIRCGFVTLNGRVPSYYEKQLAQEVVLRIFSRAIIKNELVIATRD